MATTQNIGWNAGARSIKTVAGNAEMTVEPNTALTDSYVGIGPAGDVTSPSEQTHSLRFTRNGAASYAYAYEVGVLKAELGAYTDDDLFMLRRIGGLVTVWKSGVKVSTSDRLSFGTVFMAAALYTAGDIV